MRMSEETFALLVILLGYCASLLAALMIPHGLSAAGLISSQTSNDVGNAIIIIWIVIGLLLTVGYTKYTINHPRRDETNE